MIIKIAKDVSLRSLRNAAKLYVIDANRILNYEKPETIH